MRYRIDVAYHGRDFYGWQKQPGLRTVQGELELWLSRLLAAPGPVAVTGAGRTDAGVHASALPGHFDVDHPVDTAQLHRRLLVALPHDMAILRLHAVTEDFHARYSAVARRYIYRMRIGGWPFDRDREWQTVEPVDIPTLHACAASIMGSHDFSGFCCLTSRRENNRCTVSESGWETDGVRLSYTIRADRFLHEMVRLIVGTSIAAARGRWTADRMTEILRSGDVRLCGDTAPVHGLTLEAVEYPPGVGEPVDFD